MNKSIFIRLICSLISFEAKAHVTWLNDTAFYTVIGYGGAEPSGIPLHLEYLSRDFKRPYIHLYEL